MNEYATEPARIFTTHGTVLYVEPTNSELRHGPPATSPRNAGIVSDGSFGQIVHMADGALRPVVSLTHASRSISALEEAASPATPTRLEIMRLDDGWIGLRAQNQYLCAEADGRVTLSRGEHHAWEHFVIPEAARVENRELNAEALNPSQFVGDDCLRNKLVIADIGAAGGLQQAWSGIREHVAAVLFEPNPEKAEELKSKDTDLFRTIVIQSALGDAVGVKTLNITKQPLCSSLLTPNKNLLKHYSNAPAFDIVSRLDVQLTTYHDLFELGKAPKPDVIKIDTQGYEYEILTGFGPLLKECLGIQLEVHVYHLYENQKLFHDITMLLDTFGLVLRKLTPVYHFDGDIVELDVWYTVRRERAEKLDAIDKWKLSLIHREWGLPDQKTQFRF